MATYTLNIPVTLNEYQLASICDCINEREEFRCRQQKMGSYEPIEVSEIVAKPALAQYISQAVTMHLLDHWNDVALESIADGCLLNDIESHR